MYFPKLLDGSEAAGRRALRLYTHGDAGNGSEGGRGGGAGGAGGGDSGEGDEAAAASLPHQQHRQHNFHGTLADELDGKGVALLLPFVACGSLSSVHALVTLQQLGGEWMRACVRACVPRCGAIGRARALCHPLTQPIRVSARHTQSVVVTSVRRLLFVCCRRARSAERTQAKLGTVGDVRWRLAFCLSDSNRSSKNVAPLPPTCWKMPEHVVATTVCQASEYVTTKLATRDECM